MKHKIIAMVLAVVVMLHFGTTQARAAAGAVAGGAALGILAVNLIGLMTGNTTDCAEAINCIVENGVEGWQNAFVGSEDCPSWFVSGWQQIYNSVCAGVQNGDITYNDDGSYTMKYSYYVALCQEILGELPFDVTFGTSLEYKKVDYFFNMTCYASTLPVLDTITTTGQSYVPIYHSGTEIYFCESYSYLKLKFLSDINKYKVEYDSYDYSSSYINKRLLSYYGGYYDNTISGSFSAFQLGFMYIGSDYNISSKAFDMYNYPVDYWYKYDGSSITQVPDSEMDKYNLSPGYLITEGRFIDFISDIKSYATIPSSDLDDLSGTLDDVLDVTKDPSLTIDTDPDITDAVAATTVTDIPGSDDIPLSNLTTEPLTSIDIPSILSQKFPFCIPFDFIRILGVFAAEPKAPVFVIPISTDPEALEAFEGNQTIGELPEDFVPMFEIDEEIVIDLSVIPLIQPICYTAFIVGFVIMLIVATPKMINH